MNLQLPSALQSAMQPFLIQGRYDELLLLMMTAA